MQDALNFCFGIISSAISWLANWSFLGVPFLVFIIAFAIIGIIIDYVF